MTKDKYQKAEELQQDIDACDDLLNSRKMETTYCTVSVEDGYEKLFAEGTIPKGIWDKMLDVLEQERDKLIREFEEL